MLTEARARARAPASPHGGCRASTHFRPRRTRAMARCAQRPSLGTLRAIHARMPQNRSVARARPPHNHEGVLRVLLQVGARTMQRGAHLPGRAHASPNAFRDMSSEGSPAPEATGPKDYCAYANARPASSVREAFRVQTATSLAFSAVLREPRLQRHSRHGCARRCVCVCVCVHRAQLSTETGAVSGPWRCRQSHGSTGATTLCKTCSAQVTPSWLHTNTSPSRERASLSHDALWTSNSRRLQERLRSARGVLTSPYVCDGHGTGARLERRDGVRCRPPLGAALQQGERCHKRPVAGFATLQHRERGERRVQGAQHAVAKVPWRQRAPELIGVAAARLSLLTSALRAVRYCAAEWASRMDMSASTHDQHNGDADDTSAINISWRQQTRKEASSPSANKSLRHLRVRMQDANIQTVSSHNTDAIHVPPNALVSRMCAKCCTLGRDHSAG